MNTQSQSLWKLLTGPAAPLIVAAACALAYANALETQPDHPELLLNSGSLLLASGDAARAELQLARALRVAPTPGSCASSANAAS